MVELPQNVLAFLNSAEQELGRHKAEEFSQAMWSECVPIKSPIEQLFLIAMNLIAEINFVTLYKAVEFSDSNDDLLLIPQWRVGKYSVDFALRQHPIDKIVCVELDGHEFHDRNERQRRHEKMRDRFLTANGYSVLHFTGAEIVRDPCAAALEAFNLATDLKDVSTHPFNVE